MIEGFRGRGIRIRSPFFKIVKLIFHLEGGGSGPHILYPTLPVDRAHFFTYVLKFLRYSIAPNLNYAHYKVKFLDQNLASGGLRLLPIMNITKEITPIFLCEKIEQSIFYLLHLDLSSKTEISIPFQAFPSQPLSVVFL